MEAGADGFKYSGGARSADLAWRVVITPGRSRLALLWVLAITGAAMAAAVTAALPPAVRAGIVLALAGVAVRSVRCHAWRRDPGAVTRFAVDLSGRIEVDRRGRSTETGRITGGSFVAPWLVVVHWIPDGARFARTIFLLPDMAGGQEMRRLRVLLRWSGIPAP